MFVPEYKGFYFSYKNKPEHFGHWQVCKEDAGRLISRNAKTQFLVCLGKRGWRGKEYTIRRKREPLEKHLNRLCKQFGVKGKAVVTTIKGHASMLRIKVPRAWLGHRVTAHILLTHIRDKIRGRGGHLKEHSPDAKHLQNAAKILRYAKRLGLSRFNAQLKKMRIAHAKGFVQANTHMRHHSRSKLYKKA